MTETSPGLVGGKNGFNKYASRMPPERGGIFLQGRGLFAPSHSGKSEPAENRHYLPTTSFVGSNNMLISVQSNDSRVLSFSMWWIFKFF